MNLKTFERKLMTIMNKYETAGFLMALVRKQSSFENSFGINFFDGEADYYTNLCKTVAKNLLAADLPDTAEFEVSTYGTVEYCYTGMKLPLFSVLMDTFRGRPRDCKNYCDMWYQRFIGALGVCVALKKEDPSQDGG